jgi:hypothetical protein
MDLASTPRPGVPPPVELAFPFAVLLRDVEHPATTTAATANTATARRRRDRVWLIMTVTSWVR